MIKAGQVTRPRNRSRRIGRTARTAGTARTGWSAAFAAALAVSVAAGSGGVALASGTAGHGSTGHGSTGHGSTGNGSTGNGTARTPAQAAVPWHRVGPGWVLAEYWPGRFAENGKPKAAAATLYLISPAGVKYGLFHWASTKAPPFLLDWSGDKTRALVQTSAGGMEQIVLATGKARRFRLGGQSSALGYTRPNGLNILGWRQTASAQGQRQQLHLRRLRRRR
jgi:hypothetical protein